MLPKPTYTVTVTSSGSGTVTGAGGYTSGETATLKATPNSGYRFDGWYNESGTRVSTNATYSFTVTQNQNFTAKFVKDTVIVPGPNTPSPDTPSPDNISEISLPQSSVNLGWVVDGRRIVYDSVTLVPQIKDYNDLKAKVVWSIEGSKTEVAEAKKYLTLSNGKLTAKKNSAGRTVTVRAQIKGTNNYAIVKVNLIGAHGMYDTIATRLDSYKDTFDINIKGKGMGAAKPNPNLGIMLPVRGITSAKANKIKWTTSDKTVATVSGTGKVTGKSAGTATITATLDGKSVQYKVRVHVASVTFKQPKGYVIEAGDQMNLTQEIESLTGIDTDVYDVKWSVPENQLKYGSVRSNGMFTAKAKGTVNVTAEINGVTNKMRIMIVP